MVSRSDRRALRITSRRTAIAVLSVFALVCAGAVGLTAVQREDGGAAAVSASNPCVGDSLPAGGIQHLVIVWFENTSAASDGTVSGAPFVNSLVGHCTHAQRYTDANYKVDGTTKDGSYNSRPSYVTEATGVSPTVHGVKDDSYTAKTTKENVWHQMQAAGRDARAYTEGRASGDVCSGGGATSGSYHNSLRAVSPTIPNAWCNQHDVDLSTFDPAHLPDLAMIFPKNTSNWHDNSVSSGDTWLNQHLSPLLNSAQYASGDTAVVFITDEDTPVVNAFIAPSIGHATIPAASHFAVGRLTAELLGLPLIGDQARAPALTGMFGNGVPPSTTSSSSTSTSSTSSSTSTSTSSTSPTTRPDGTSTQHSGTQFVSSMYLYVVNSGCWEGGNAWDTDAWDGPWDGFHHSAAWSIKGPNVTIRGTVAVNFGDAYQVASTDSAGWLLDHVYGVYGHDDAIENDRHQAGTVKGSIFTTFVGYSDSGENTTDGSARTVTLDGNYIQLAPIPGTYKPDTYGTPGTGSLFKLDSNAARLRLIGNTFVASVIPASYGSLEPPPADKLAACTGNTVKWLGTPGGFPASAKAAWLARCPDTIFVGA